MDWKSKVILIVGLYMIVLRLRMKVMLLWYCIMRERHQQYRKRKRSKRYSMIKKIPKQIEHLSNLVRENDTVCIEQLRMDRNAFGRLCQILRNAGGLEDEKYVSVTEQVALFLHILAHHKKNVSIKLYYKRSGATVSLYFNRTLDAFLRLYHMFFARPEPINEDSVDPLWKYFSVCLGALDGTHVKVRVPITVKNRYRSRKGEISTNVLAVCNKNMNFIYALSGWEGSAADSRVLRDAMSREPGLQVPEVGFEMAVDPIEDQFNNVPESVDNNDYIDNSMDYWCEIFGKDRATGEKACDFSTNEKRDSEKRNAEKIEGEKISRSKKNDKVSGYDTYFTDCYFVQDEDGESDHVKIVSPTAGGRAKKKKMDHYGVIDDSLNVMMNSFMNETKEALLGLNRYIEKLCNGDLNAALAMAALKNISSLSQFHRIEVAQKLVDKPMHLQLFVAMDAEDQLDYVKNILGGKI
ncbi:hypothetical protein OROMI_009114 [Orobanche minor]